MRNWIITNISKPFDYSNSQLNMHLCTLHLWIFYDLLFCFLTRSKTVVPHRPKNRTLPRFAPQVSINPDYLPCCRGRRKVFYHVYFPSWNALICRILARFARFGFFVQIVKNVTKLPNRGKTGQVDAVKSSKNVVGIGEFYYCGTLA